MTEERIDTRELVEELAALEAMDPADGDIDDEDTARMADIRALFDEISGYAGDTPPDGIFLIREDSFEDYARELADDIGAVDMNAGWPTYCIDWKMAARDLAMDYTTVEFDGATYYYR